MPQGQTQTGEGGDHRRQDIPPADSGDQQHPAAHARQENGRPTVWLDKDQAEDKRDEQARKQNAAFPGLHLALIMFPIPGESQYERQFGQFRGLKTHWAKTEPAAGAVNFARNVWHQHQKEQHERKSQQRPNQLLQRAIIQ